MACNINPYGRSNGVVLYGSLLRTKLGAELNSRIPLKVGRYHSKPCRPQGCRRRVLSTDGRHGVVYRNKYLLKENLASDVDINPDGPALGGFML